MAKELEIKENHIRAVDLDKLKEKAIELIHEQYGLAAEARVQGLTSYGTIDPEFTRALTAQHIVEFAQNLGLFTEEEAEALKREYWDKRDEITDDVPDARV